ncbi:DUF637 domain-containing protein [Candidatus Vondammii sp. HM_W22]|uniref:DUF637 domain-containing protein n=1 Tax=Candidatus Vondammii sp. HM_W22 TaxID=2687299 RepID=UPI001F134F91|nr:DUF637 domain-containing protein [Candidatus Vondammii sp. HM_W22]
MVNNQPGHPYLVETNPEFTKYTNFISSDYFLDKVGLKPEQTAKRLGDGFYENRLIRDAIFEATGRRYLAGQTNDQEQFRFLMDNAIASQQELGLSAGITLSPEQVARLTHDIVWMVEQEVQGQKVLVPVYYAAALKADDISPGGSLLIASELSISADEMTNTGSIEAENDLNIRSAGDLLNRGGLRGKNLSIVAENTIRNTGGHIISSGDVLLVARTGNIELERQVKQITYQRNSDSIVTLIGNASKLKADGKITLQAEKEIRISASDIEAGDDLIATAGCDIRIETVENKWHRHLESKHFQDIDTVITHKKSSLTAGGDVTLNAGQDIAVIGSDIAAEGDVALSAEGDTTIESVEDSEYHYQYTKKNFGRSKTTILEQSRVRNVASTLQAGGDVLVNVDKTDAGLVLNTAKNVSIIGSNIKARQDILVYAGDRLEAASGTDFDDYHYELTKKGLGGLTGSSHKQTRSQQRRQSAKIASGDDINLTAGNHIVLIAPNLSAKNDIAINAQAGNVYLGTAKDTDYADEEYDRTGAFSWETGSEGHLDETVRHTEMTAGGDIRIDAGNGVIVEYKQQDSLAESISNLSQLPELAWMGELQQREDINWQAIEEAHDAWQQHESGMGGPGFMLIAIAIATGGAGAGLLGLSQGAAAGTLTAVEAAQIAVVDALINKAAVSLIINRGDIGAVFKDLTSKEGLLSLATAGITAGMTNSLYGQLGIPQTAKLSTLTTEQLVKRSLVDAAVKTGVNAAVYGKSSFKENLQYSAVNAIGAKLAREIGGARDSGGINYAVHKIAHAVLGCAVGAGTGGECAGGAIGAVAGEIAGEAYLSSWLEDKLNDPRTATLSPEALQLEIHNLQSRGVDIARLAGGLAAFAAGEDLNSAVDAAGNAVENNVLCGGLCLGALALLAGAIYSADQGDGDLLAGLEKIGTGEDDLGRAINSGVTKAVELSYQQFPEATIATLDVLSAVGEGITATVTWLDDSTGNEVSAQWHKLDEKTRNQIVGGGKILALVIPEVSVAKLVQLKRLAGKTRGKGTGKNVEAPGGGCPQEGIAG